MEVLQKGTENKLENLLKKTDCGRKVMRTS